MASIASDSHRTRAKAWLCLANTIAAYSRETSAHVVRSSARANPLACLSALPMRQQACRHCAPLREGVGGRGGPSPKEVLPDWNRTRIRMNIGAIRTIFCGRLLRFGAIRSAPRSARSAPALELWLRRSMAPMASSQMAGAPPASGPPARRPPKRPTAGAAKKATVGAPGALASNSLEATSSSGTCSERMPSWRAARRDAADARAARHTQGARRARLVWRARSALRSGDEAISATDTRAIGVCSWPIRACPATWRL